MQVLTAAVREAQLPGAGPTSRDPTAAVPAGAAYRMDENITVFVVRWSCVGIVDVLRAAVVVGAGCRLRQQRLPDRLPFQIRAGVNHSPDRNRLGLTH